MYITSKESKKSVIAVCCLILLAWALRQSDLLHLDKFTEALLYNIRPYIYIGIFTYWGLTLRKRIVQSSTRRKLWIMSIAMVVWMCIRTIKYICLEGSVLWTRIFWYLFYVPMLTIPLMGLLAAMSFDKPENYRTPKWAYSIYAVAALLMLLVLTNDFHQLVFKFSTIPYDNQNYSYGIGYLIIAAYIFVTILATYTIILIRGRLPKKKTPL